MKGHELAKILLSLPDAEVTIIQHNKGQYTSISDVRYGVEQDHSTGELVKDENGNDELCIRID